MTGRDVLLSVVVALALAVLNEPVYAQSLNFVRIAGEELTSREIADIRLRAEQGYPDAQFALGVMHWEGRSVEQDDGEAARWFRLAADQGEADGQTALGDAYWDGRGVPQDDREAVRWFRLAAEQGNAFSQTQLGIVYWEGRGAAQDDREAVQWFRQGAEGGNSVATSWLALAYSEGRGVLQDFVFAHAWANLAASRLSGDMRVSSVEMRDEAAKRLTSEELDAAQRLAEQLMAVNPPR